MLPLPGFLPCRARLRGNGFAPAPPEGDGQPVQPSLRKQREEHTGYLVWPPARGCLGQQGLIWSGGSTVPQSLSISAEPESPQRNRAALSPLLSRHSPHDSGTR